MNINISTAKHNGVWFNVLLGATVYTPELTILFQDFYQALTLHFKGNIKKFWINEPADQNLSGIIFGMKFVARCAEHFSSFSRKLKHASINLTHAFNLFLFKGTINDLKMFVRKHVWLIKIF